MAVDFSGDPDVLTLTAGGTVTVGDVDLLGSGGGAKRIVGVAMATRDTSQEVPYKVRGVVRGVAAQSDAAWVAGDVLYWDNTNAKFTKTAADNCFRAGYAHADKASATATGDVCLVPSGVTT